MYKSVKIFYFSGTGNSRNTARWFAETARKLGSQPAEHSITDAGVDDLTIQPDELLVFTSPVHGFNYPPLMLRFLVKFPRGKNNVVLMNTRGGMKIGRFNTPGLSGIAFYLASFILVLKGYSIRAMCPIDLPSNWLSLHPGLNEGTVKYLHEKNKTKVAALAEKTLLGQSDFRALKELVQDILISPISLMYYLIGRFILAKTFYASADCNDCDACIKNCPAQAIKKVNNRPFWTFNCESCMKCMSNCPKRAIETAHGFIVSILVVFNSLILYNFYRYFAVYFGEIKSEAVKFVIEPVICLVVFGLSYRLIHYLMRFKFMERLMVYTSLTKYKFWGRRYKALRNF